jgi:hypothetical protein
MAETKGITVQVGCEYTSCKDCGKYDIRSRVYDCFDWSSLDHIIGYRYGDKKITVSKKGLLQVIQMVNPAQEDRDVVLVDEEMNSYKTDYTDIEGHSER